MLQCVGHALNALSRQPQPSGELGDRLVPNGRGGKDLPARAGLTQAPGQALAAALLKAGANPNLPGPGGDTATSIARQKSDAALLGLMRQHGGR